MGLALVSFLYLASMSRVISGEEKLQMNNLGMATHFWRVSEASNTDVGCLQLATLRDKD